MDYTLQEALAEAVQGARHLLDGDYNPSRSVGMSK